MATQPQHNMIYIMRRSIGCIDAEHSRETKYTNSDWRTNNEQTAAKEEEKKKAQRQTTLVNEQKKKTHAKDAKRTEK